jgi:hypothetical protein
MNKIDMQNTFLSKSQFIRGLQCHKSLYLHRHYPELRNEVLSAQQALFQSGQNVGEFARELFPEGIIIQYEGVPLSEQIENTAAAISGEVDTIYEAAFCYDGVFIKADILHRGRHGWELYEVKSSAGVKDIHLRDVALQYHVLTGAGLPVSKVALVHINNRYIRNGAVELKKLFTISDFTKTVAQYREEIISEISRQKQMLCGEMPAIDIGEHCTNPYDCDFMGYCWQHIPLDSIFDISGRFAQRFDLYRQGIVRLADVPDVVLSKPQRQQKRATLEKRNFISARGIKRFLDSLHYPLCFLDFECVSFPIPPYDGLRPYQHIPYQYSMHILERDGAALQHFEYLAEDTADHRQSLLEKLLRDIPPQACVLAYNAAYEIGRLKDLAAWYPAQSKKIEAVISSIRDLAKPFRARAVYYYQMNGSYSIKSVLPALVPEMSYDALDISDGNMAMQAYLQMMASPNLQEKQRLKKALLDYCRLDSLGMVKIYETLKKMTA